MASEQKSTRWIGQLVLWLRSLKNKVANRYYRWRYGQWGKPRTMLGVKKQLAQLNKLWLIKQLTFSEKDSPAESLAKAQDVIVATMVAYTLNWCLGLVQQPPFEMLKEQIRGRREKTDVAKAVSEILLASKVDAELIQKVLKQKNVKP